MIEVLPAPDHVLAMRISGTLTADDYDQVMHEVDAKLARHRRIGLFVDMTGFQDITPEAAAKDLRYAFGKIGQWSRFPREAVVTDKHWLRLLVKVFSPLAPQIEARTFSPAERDQALAFASEVRPS